MFASLCVQYLYPTPWLFAIGLASSTFIFVMVGALGARYATISFGSLLIAIYTMLGAAKAPDLFYQPLALGAGALWYGLVSFIWLWLLPYKTLHEQLARVTSPLVATCWKNPASSRRTSTAPRPFATIWPSSTSIW